MTIQDLGAIGEIVGVVAVVGLLDPGFVPWVDEVFALG